MKAQRMGSGIHLEDNKIADGKKITTVLTQEGDEFFVSFSQHIGAPSICVVQKDEEIVCGSLLAKAADGLSVPVHSPICGTVLSVSKIFHPVLGLVEGCTLKASKNQDDFIKIDQGANLEECVRNAGIIGLGGAGFPTYAKLSSAKNIDTILINAAECEPYLTCDNALMLNRHIEILKGVKILKDELKVDSAIIAIEDNKNEAIELLKQDADKFGVDIVSVPVKYPQGGEKQLIKSVLNRIVPLGKLPRDVKTLVQNVATVYAIYEAVELKKPLYERAVTFSGDIPTHMNYLTKIGTPASRLFMASGLNESELNDKQFVFGGPMTGFNVPNANIPIYKTTGGVLALPQIKKEPINCIRCGKCAEVCVMGLIPTDLEHYYNLNDIDSLKKNDALSCIECGCCSYSCPSRRLLAESIKVSKKLISMSAVKV